MGLQVDIHAGELFNQSFPAAFDTDVTCLWDSHYSNWRSVKLTIVSFVSRGEIYCRYCDSASKWAMRTHTV